MSIATTLDTYKTELISRNHHYLADEPLEKGGQNLGPTPSELLHSALASCTSITLRLYATRKEWQIDEIKVEVTDGINQESKESILTKNITLISNLDEAQLKRMLSLQANVLFTKYWKRALK